MDDWSLIDTCPENEYVLVWDVGNHCVIIAIHEVQAGKRIWFDHNDEELHYELETSHWQPLPERPLRT